MKDDQRADRALSSKNSKSQRQTAENSTDFLNSDSLHLPDFFPLPYQIMDIEGRILKVNRMWQRMLGYSEDEVAGKPVSEFLTSECQEYFSKRFNKFVSSGELLVDECTLRSKDGSTVYVTVNCRIEEGDKVSPSLIHCTMNDVTEMRRMEKALRDSEQKYRQAVESASEIIFTSDLLGNFQLMNAAGCRIVGCPLEEFMKMNYLDVVHPQYRRRVQIHYMRQYLNRQLSSYIEFPIKTANSETVWLGQSANLRTSNDEPIGFHIIGRDITERINAQQALEESESRYRTTLNSMKDAIHVVDKNLNIRLYNQAFAEWIKELGLSTDIINKEVLEAFPFLADSVVEEYLWVFENNKTLVTEESYDINGSEIITETRKIPSVVDGKVNRIITVVRDITERKRAEEALRESEERFRSLYENSTIGLYRTTPDGQILMANPALVRMLGFDSFEELAERDLEKEGFELDFPRDKFKKAMEDKDVIRGLETPWKRRDGSTVFVRESAKVMRDNTGNAVYYEGTVEDISDKKKAELALRDSETRLRTIFESAKEGMFLADKKGNYVDVNPAGCEMIGYAKAELLNSNVETLLFPEDFEMAFRLGREIKSSGIDIPEIRLKRKDESEIWVDMTVTPIKFGAENLLLGIKRDITEKKKAEQEQRKLEARIQQSQKLESLSVLAGGIAHYFNNMLTGVIGNANIALMDLSPASPVRFNIEELEKVAQKAAVLTNQMLAYSGKGRFVVKSVNITELIRKTDHLIGIAVSNRIGVIYNLEDELPYIDADPSQIRQLVVNLMANASEAYDGEAGTIKISTGVKRCDKKYLEGTYYYEAQPEGQYVFLEIADDAAGMDEMVLDKLFDPFFSTRFTGRGLGMAAVLGIVRGHSGAIKVVSKSGEGTDIVVLFPPSDRHTDNKDAKQSSQHNLRGKEVILVVEEEENVAGIVKKTLERYDYSVIISSDTPEGISALRQQPDAVEVILLNVVEPTLFNFSSLKKIREINPHLKIILTSGYSEELTLEFLEEHKVEGFLQKPYQMLNILKEIRRVLGKDDA